MRVATWNVNSVKARLERLVSWLMRHQPDVFCLQELKVPDDAFPFEAVKQAGYSAAVFGQKTYNGVAILTKKEPRDVRRGLEERPDDTQARAISVEADGVRVYSIYAPNGQEVGSDKWAYKLDWLRTLRTHLDRHYTIEGRVILCGDFNVAPHAKDVANPEAWEPSVLFHAEARAAYEQVRGFGLRDVFEQHHPEGGQYTWWDYRMLAFPKNNGLRIDHILATPPLAGRCTAATIDRAERKGKLPSDHAPVVAEFDV
jgi:exodeoxyribonuclease-3